MNLENKIKYLYLCDTLLNNTNISSIDKRLIPELIELRRNIINDLGTSKGFFNTVQSVNGEYRNKAQKLEKKL